MPDPFGGPPPAYVEGHLPFTGDVEAYRAERVPEEVATRVRAAFTAGESPDGVPVRDVRIRTWAEAVAEATIDNVRHLLVSFPPREPTRVLIERGPDCVLTETGRHMLELVGHVLEPTFVRFECPRCSLIFRLKPIEVPHDGPPFCSKCGQRCVAEEVE